MNRDDIKELHYITPMANLASILEHGILSHRRAAKLRHESVAKPEVQDLRAKVRVPGGRPLHEYVNLYFCARNPMLYKRQGMHHGLCVLSIKPLVIDTAGAVITDQNAASPYVRFTLSPLGLALLNEDWVFAEDWRHPGDSRAYYQHRSIKCAEVLVPDLVDPNHILGAYVSNAGSAASLSQQAPGLRVAINARLFFQ